MQSIKINVSIPVYIINLKRREDRKSNILRQYNGKDEFSTNVIEAHEHKIGAMGLWSTVKYILQDLTKDSDKFIIICEDDHQFTKEYSQAHFFRCIEEAKEKDADILLGGVSGFTSTIQASENLYWVEKFSGL